VDVKKLKNYAFVVLNLEKFWKRLCSQNRQGKQLHAFVRRGRVGPKNTKHLFFYVTHPRKEIQGYADFIERVTGDAKELWQSLGHESLLGSYDEYQDFLQGRKTATFIRFKNLREFPKPVTMTALAKIIGKQRLPQIGLYLTEPLANQLLSAGGVNLE
jgi:predicted transcriptional regulator